MKAVLSFAILAIVAAGIQAGPCEFVCQLSLVPVCGSDGFTYASECDLRRVDCIRRGLVPLTVAYQGRCKCDEVMCNRSMIPLCGDDGVSYDNDCALKQAACRQEREIGVAHQGRC